MRDADRIPQVFAELEQLWRFVPDQRFAQFFRNYTRSVDDSIKFNTEDFDLVDLIRNQMAIDGVFDDFIEKEEYNG